MLLDRAYHHLVYNFSHINQVTTRKNQYGKQKSNRKLLIIVSSRNIFDCYLQYNQRTQLPWCFVEVFVNNSS